MKMTGLNDRSFIYLFISDVVISDRCMPARGPCHPRQIAGGTSQRSEEVTG